MTWIMLAIHPEHDKVLRLADLTESHPDTAFSAAVRWFRWVDAHAEDAAMSVSLAGFRGITRWPSDALALGMLAPPIDWLMKGRDGRLSPTRLETYFSRSARRRGLHARMVAHVRAQSERTTGAPQDITGQDIQDKIHPNAPTRRKPPVDAGSEGWWGAPNGPQFSPEARQWRGITEADQTAWAAAYPAADVQVEIARAGEWCAANGARGKKHNYRKFLTGWLSRCQDRGGSHGSGDGTNRGFAGGAAKAGAAERRATRRADEFSESLTLPVVRGSAGGGPAPGQRGVGAAPGSA